MAAKDKKSPTKKTTSQTNVTRLTASDPKKSTPKKVMTQKATTTPKIKATEDKKRTSSPLKKLISPFAALGTYFKGAWYELNQVTWPKRKATWSLTGALLVFTAFFIVMILLLDTLFQYLFELILG